VTAHRGKGVPKQRVFDSDAEADAYMQVAEHFMLDDDPEREERLPKCATCNGTGIAVEGWDCEDCDGYGNFEY
jgi:hypothetical protein